MSVYSNLDYKSLIRARIEELQAQDGPRAYTFEALARHCRVQKTYLSKVLNREGNLNPDQLYRACEYLRFQEKEREFVFLIYEHENTQIESRRKELKAKIEAIRSSQEKTEAHLDVQTQDNQTIDLLKYYADADLVLIHMFLTIRRYALNPDLLLEDLSLGKPRLNKLLEDLEQMGVIRQEGSGWKVIKDNMHLSKTDLMYKVYRQNMRLKALEKMNKEDSQAYSFSVAFSSEPKVREQIQENFMNFLKSTQKLVQSGQEKEVYQINFDLLSWSEKFE